MALNNAINLQSNGVVTFNNSTGVFTGSAVTQHDVLIGGASNAIVSVAPSATSGVPLISQGAAADPAFGTAVVAGGGTGAVTFTAYSVICAGTTATGAFQNVSGVGTSGQVLTSQGASALPQWANAPAGGLTWNDVTGTSASMAVNNGYLADNAALVTLTLPATAAQFSIIEVKGYGAGGWTIAQNANQQIRFGSATATTVGVGGSLSSTNLNDGVRLLATVAGASTIWTVTDSIGNITIV
jgi:hypothetical protein